MKLSQVFRPAVAGMLFFLATSLAGYTQGAAISLGVQDYDSSAPVEITSEELELDQETGTAIFTGDVIVRQGDMTMTCQRMQVEYGVDPDTGKNEITVIRMFGGVTFVSKQEAAEADRAVYDLSTDMLIMYENVLVTQGATALSADQLTYNLASGNGRMEGNVKTVLQQGNN